MDAWSDSYRANGRRALRAQRTSEESDWRSVFATVTFNFLGDKASLDLGGRYTGISKKAEGSNNHAEWFVIDRVEAGGDGSIVRIPAGFDIRGSSTRAQISRAILEQHPGIANGSIVGRSNMSTICTDLYGEQLNSGFISENSRCASVSATISDDSFDPQVVFRYRTSDDVSWYVKYATSFKSGAFDNGVSEVARFIWEVGMRGNFMDGRLSAEATLFTTDMTGVQVSFIDRVLDRNITKNIAEQSSDGLELGLRFAASDRITLSAYAAFLDATIDKFEDAVCTEDERVTGNCREEDGPDGPAGTTDRSGADARNAPDWQLTASMQWELPTIISGLRHDLDITFLASDDYVTDRSFSRVIDMPSYEDLNVSYEIGPEAGRWSLLSADWNHELCDLRGQVYAQLRLVFGYKKTRPGIGTCGAGALFFRKPIDPIMRLRSAVFSVAIVLGALGVSAAAASRFDTEDSAAHYRAVLDQYCVTCHNAVLKTAGMVLDTADVADISAAPQLWERVVTKLSLSAMPPAGWPRRGGRSAAKPGPPDRPPPQSHGIRKRDPGPARHRYRRRSIAAGRQYWRRLRQHRRSTGGIAAPDGTLPVCRGPGQ
jgi:hypothetical protein